MTWDSKWSAVSALAAIAALLVPLVLFVMNRDLKELSVETVSRAVLVDLTDPDLSSLKLTYRGVSVSRLTVATIEVRNSGTRPIEQTDFERPVVIRFAEPSNVLAITVSEKVPADLKPVINSDAGGISLAPLLLNPGDRFRLTAQIRGDFSEPLVEARISGVPAVVRRTFPESNPTTRRGLTLIVAGLVSTMTYFYLAGFAAQLIRRRRPFAPLRAPDALAVILVLGVAGSGLVSAGVRLLDLSNTHFLFTVAAAVLTGILVFVLAVRRSMRAWARLETQTAVEKGTTNT